MISAATGAMALLMIGLAEEHGLQYLLVATILTGVLQILAGAFKLPVLMRFVSRSVITGFVNALAILIFMAQLPELTNVPWTVYAMVAAGLGLIYGFPLLTRAVPSPLVAIVVLTVVALALNLDIRTVSDMGQLPDSLPAFLLPQVPLSLDMLWIVLPVSATLAVVGLLESMLAVVLLSALFFARKVGRVLHIGSVSANEGRQRDYVVTGQVFFASADSFIAGFDFTEAVERVNIDVSRAHFWDLSAIGALDKVVIKFRREGTEVELIGMNEASATLVDRLGVHDKPDAITRLTGH